MECTVCEGKATYRADYSLYLCDEHYQDYLEIDQLELELKTFLEPILTAWLSKQYQAGRKLDCLASALAGYGSKAEDSFSQLAKTLERNVSKEE